MAVVGRELHLLHCILYTISFTQEMTSPITFNKENNDFCDGSI